MRTRILFAAAILVPGLLAQQPYFEKRTLDFVLDHRPTPEKRMFESMAGGMAALDFDNDGRLDLAFTNPLRLYRNEGDLKFRDVTPGSGFEAGDNAYLIGLTTGDFDADGLTDIFAAGIERNVLFRNLGNGKFADVTAQTAGIPPKTPEWGIAAAFLDADGDGRLDLFVTNYGLDRTKSRFCGDANRKLRVYCHPKYFDPRPNQLYRNLGNGKFADISTESGISKAKGRGMSVAIADYDADGKPDIFVTNDNMANFLFHNLGKGKFEETGLLAGVALLDHGKPVANMGADFRDVDNDGKPDIAVTALNNETFPFFRNDGAGTFHDATSETRLGQLAVKYGGWGAAIADFDNDGAKDLFTTNSHVNDLVEQFEPGMTYLQPNTLFRNDGTGKFVDSACPNLKQSAAAHRGMAVADFDGDGRLDVVVTVLGGPTELWRNIAPAKPWIAFRTNRIGTSIDIGKQSNTFTPSLGYASASHTPVHFGVSANDVPQVIITWPDGTKKVLEKVAANRVVNID
ncbi:RNA-binding protein [Bryobacterales bacterium F-183]|nr:RNA-binding protein [Bryobacterales bacterium F-183]